MRNLSTGCLPVEGYKLYVIFCGYLWIMKGHVFFMAVLFSVSAFNKDLKRALLVLTAELIIDN